MSRAERYFFLLRRLAEFPEPVCFTMRQHEWRELLQELEPYAPALAPYEDMMTLYGFVREAAATPADIAALQVPPQYWRALLYLIDPRAAQQPSTHDDKRTLN